MTTADEIERTGRDRQVVPKEPGSLERSPGLDEEAPGDRVDSADFPGTAAP